jgi:hypothetical protein
LSRYTPSCIITDRYDEDGEAAGVIRIDYDDGTSTDYPYNDSAERADQLRNARGDAEGYDVTDLSDTFISEPQP